MGNILDQFVHSFFNQRIVNVWNRLPRTVDFTSLTSFKRTINDVDYYDFLKVFFILILLFSTCCSVLVLSYCTTLLYFIWAVVSAVAAFLTLGTYVFIVHTVFLYSLTVLLCVSKIN